MDFLEEDPGSVAEGDMVPGRQYCLAVRLLPAVSDRLFAYRSADCGSGQLGVGVFCSESPCPSSFPEIVDGYYGEAPSAHSEVLWHAFSIFGQGKN